MHELNRLKNTQIFKDLGIDLDKNEVPKREFPKRWLITSIILIVFAIAYYFIQNDFTPDYLEEGHADDHVVMFIAAFFVLKIPTLIKKAILFALEYLGRILFSAIISIVCFIYGISPVDIIPDVVPIFGLGDDAAVFLIGLYKIFRILKIINLAKKLLIVGAILLVLLGVYAIVTHFFT